MFDEHKIFKTDLAGRTLVIETGKIAQLANGSCFVRYGDTVVNVAVTSSRKPRDGIDFFPLSVDFEERLYSVGKIPGSYLKREGRPTDKAVLSSRIIDRPIRPLFPKDLRNDVSVVCTVMSVDPDCLPEIAAVIGVSCALSISDIPWGGPISSINIGLVNDDFVINPTAKQREISEMSLTVASTKKLVTMIEASANEISNEVMLEAIMFGHKINTQIVEFIENIKSQIGKEKFTYDSKYPELDVIKNIEDFAKKDIKSAFNIKEKHAREKFIDKIYDKTLEHFYEIYPESKEKIQDCLYIVQKKEVRSLILNERRRVDGRNLDELRPLDAEVGILPRTHGSSLFTRGQTQVLTAVTLGPMSDQQMLDGIDGDESKRYIHHYNFPSYSVGETKPSRGPGRREIGHGALAEKALIPVLPDIEKFPYAIRLVSEVVSSNGSTSQGAICASTLALMDAGVPIKSPVAGISCGLVSDGDGNFVTMIDIQGIEDFFGDMDFKVAGTHEGITAIQMDLKIKGLTREIIEEALFKTRKAREYILNEVLLKAIGQPREELSEYAPKMLSLKIPVEKIRDVIGSGGKIVQKICSEHDVSVDIEESGRIFVSSKNIENCKKAVNMINMIINDPKIGVICKARVTRLMDFGAFVEIAPGKEALCHISQLDTKRTEKTEDVVKIDDEIFVKITEIDDRGRINVSRKDALMSTM
ncbi:MAG: polyribonucleotide nucleotidyltransferase [Oscillospiraceae bacterium]|jgi:polyribonucleotide nucleotidyltransferase|nr:polyribonucleotide nucleotidyltransferase [Oscillospiraceae bacterium]